MITQVSFNTSPIRIGERRLLRVWGDEPFAAEIKCFVENPPPPVFKSCPECGTFSINSGEPLVITPSDVVFANNEGSLEITVRDNSGDERQFSLKVISGTSLINITGTSSAPSSSSSSGGSALPI